MTKGIASMCANIELFDEYTGKILAELYQNFPMPIHLDNREVSGHRDINEYGEVLDETGEASKNADIALYTVEWLIEAGYVHSKHGRTSQYTFATCVLSAKGLKVLKATPDSIKQKKYLGDMLVTAVKKGTADSVKEIAKLIISQGIKLAMG